MEITDIIGKGKVFEPPFSTYRGASPYIFDANQKLVAYIDYAAIEYLNYHTRLAIRSTLAKHICDLLNREHVKQIPD